MPCKMPEMLVSKTVLLLSQKAFSPVSEVICWGWVGGGDSFNIHHILMIFIILVFWTRILLLRHCSLTGRYYAFPELDICPTDHNSSDRTPRVFAGKRKWFRKHHLHAEESHGFIWDTFADGRGSKSSWEPPASANWEEECISSGRRDPY